MSKKQKISTLNNRQIKALIKFVYGSKPIRGPVDETDWNFIMRIVDKIENIIGHSVSFETHYIKISWWFSKSKVTRFDRGFGGGGGHIEPREPFDSIGGKFYNFACYYGYIQFKPEKGDLLAETKQEAVLISCYHFIQWYNKNVKK